MLLHLPRDTSGAFLATHLTDFPTAVAAARWRRGARVSIESFPGLAMALALPMLGSRARAGFGGGTPALGTQVLLSAWRNESDFETFRRSPLAAALAEGSDRGAWVLFEVASTRGSFRGAGPLSSGSDPSGPFAALTLGRSRPLALGRFIREGIRLGPLLADAPGLVTAFSAGNPLSGNCTLSLWESEGQMVDFAYGEPGGHRQTASRTPPILREQLNARLRLRSCGGDLARVGIPSSLPGD